MEGGDKSSKTPGDSRLHFPLQVHGIVAHILQLVNHDDLPVFVVQHNHFWPL